jgi:hypothetical protein
MNEETLALVGSWRLASWVAVGEDGSSEQPMGPDPDGLLIYSAEGLMITTIGRAGRPRVAGDDPVSGPADERLAAAETFIAYSGTFVVDGGEVAHSVDMSLFPNWVGTQQRRHVTLSADGDTLTLSTDRMMMRGRRAIQRLTWRRIHG